MNQGRIIEFIDKGKLICALCLQDRGDKLHLLTTSNREVNLSLKRAMLISKTSIDASLPREELLNRLKRKEDLRDGHSREVQVQDLWELLKDEEESFDPEYLAQLCFMETVNDDHISALLRALFEDRTFFRMKEGRFLPNSGERIEQIIKEREERALREENLSQGSTWLKEILQNRRVQPPPCQEEIIAVLTNLALSGSEAPNFEYGKELLRRAGIPDVEQSRNLLIKLGIWEEDENLDLLRTEIRTAFDDEVLIESDEIAKAPIGLAAGREDLRDLPVMTIDGPSTRDFDDALSIVMDGNLFHLGIHIADVAGQVPPESALDKEALQRGSSLYLPRCQIPMMPPQLSQNSLSLKKGCDRGAISLRSTFDRDGNLMGYRLVPSLIRVQNQLTYDHVNDLYLEETPFGQMVRLSQILRQNRINNDALILSLPEISVQIGPDSSITLRKIEQETPSRTLVAEFMIFYNWMIAKFCRDHNIPTLYRGQEAPSERLSLGEAGYLFFLFKQRRKLHPLLVDVDPRPHTGLGLDLYTNASSPLRRYLDLVVQRQVRNFLFGQSLVYTKEDLEKIRVSVTPFLKELDRIRQRRFRYWILKYLLQHMDDVFSALIIDVMKNKYRVLLTDLLLLAEMKGKEGKTLSEGTTVKVKVEKCNPLKDLLLLRYEGETPIAPL
ncbi:MAG: RNB domain-containing ribonuclease [Pseudomonadota bacterium]